MPGAEPTLPPFEVRAVLVGEHEYRLVGPLEQSTVAGPKIGGPGGPGGPGGAAGSAVDGDHVDDRTARAVTYQQRNLGPRTRMQCVLLLDRVEPHQHPGHPPPVFPAGQETVRSQT